MAQVAAREMLVGYTETNFHGESGAALRQRCGRISALGDLQGSAK